jgi:adenosylcobinamide-phosphate synthase
MQAGVALLALICEAVLGYPRWLQPHPVVWIGNLIGGLERVWNRADWSDGARRGLGVLLLLVIVGVAGGIGAALTFVLGPLLLALVATVTLAQRSLHEHVAAVAAGLRRGDLVAARASVGMIVGRDTGAMSAEDVARAAIESLAESFSDGVVAPAFWLVVGGLPGAFIYKAVNTADSMVGHMEPRYRAFGWASARMDDLLNLVPARIAGALFCAGDGRGWRVMFSDAGKHASPNAGWPEAALAGVLNVRLGGAVAYDGVLQERPVFNAAGRAPSLGDLERGLRRYRVACGLLWVIVAGVAAGAFATGTLRGF